MSRGGSSVEPSTGGLPPPGMLPMVAFGLLRALHNVRGDARIVLVSSPGAFLDRPTVLRRKVSFRTGRTVSQTVTNRLEVDEDVGVKPPLHRERSSVKYGMRLIQNHVSRLHGNIVRFAIVCIHFYRPRFIHILVDIDYGRCHQRHSVHVRCKDGVFLVDSNAVQAALRQLLPHPLLQCASSSIPDSLLNHGPATAQCWVLNRHKVRVADPVIGIRVARRPIFLRSPVLVDLPKVLDELEHSLGRSNFLETEFRVILHRLGLSQTHLNSVTLCRVTCLPLPPATVVIPTSLDELVVRCLLISERVLIGRNDLVVMDGK
mmetsp:Transcript_25362/g.59348  ORF Transcript_25362/g.59348 Transcript_25362/m.59348 type:complete len:318 (-) Transcript_25362:320-1273(-)